MSNAPSNSSSMMTLTTEIVSAFVSHNALPMAELVGLVQTIHTALAGLANGVRPQEPAVELTPAVSIKQSIKSDYLICLDNGKKFKSLKRHLSTLGMTPEQYRAKWKLPADYPMVAPAYSAARSSLAKSMGLGQQRRKPTKAKRKVA